MSVSFDINDLYSEIRTQVFPVLDYYDPDPFISREVIPWLRKFPRNERYINSQNMAMWLLNGKTYVIELAERLIDDINYYVKTRDRLIKDDNFNEIENVNQRLYELFDLFMGFLGCSKVSMWYLRLIEINMNTHTHLANDFESILRQTQFLCDIVTGVLLE